MPTTFICLRTKVKKPSTTTRGISLLSIAGKLLACILMNRITKYLLDSVVSERQCGFRQNWGTVDMIFTIRYLQEKCLEQHQNTYLLFKDLRPSTPSADLASDPFCWNSAALPNLSAWCSPYTAAWWPESLRMAMCSTHFQSQIVWNKIASWSQPSSIYCLLRCCLWHSPRPVLVPQSATELMGASLISGDWKPTPKCK